MIFMKKTRFFRNSTIADAILFYFSRKHNVLFNSIMLNFPLKTGSKYADAQTPTEVELVILYDERTYTVKSSQKIDRPKARG